MHLIVAHKEILDLITPNNLFVDPLHCLSEGINKSLLNGNYSIIEFFLVK